MPILNLVFFQKFSFLSVTLPHQLYQKHENEKKNEYEERVINVEHGSFTALVCSTSGGFSKTCTKFLKRLAALLMAKRKEEYSDSMSYIRRSLRFCILKATLISIRGFRGYKEKKNGLLPLSEVDFCITEFNRARADDDDDE